MKPFYKKPTLSIIFLFFWLSPTQLGIGCGIEDWNTPLFSEYSFFDPDAKLMASFRETPSFSFNRFFFPKEIGRGKSSASANIQEWHQFFSGNISEKDLAYLIYSMPISTVQNIHQYLQNSAFDLPDSLKNKSYLTYFAQNPNKISFFEYLAFAKDCELNNHYSANDWELADDYKEEEGIFYAPFEMDMNTLAWRYNLDVELIKKLNNWPTQTNRVYTNQKIIVRYSYKEYVAKSGETLEKIAQKHRIDVNQLYRWNNIPYIQNDYQNRETIRDIDDILKEGNTITLYINPNFIPIKDLKVDEEIYEEKELTGHKFSEIADWYNMPEQDLKAYNKIGFDRKTYYGQKLRIPKINHLVSANETVETLAERYNQSEWKIEKMLRGYIQEPRKNQQSKYTLLKEGQRILIYKNPHRPKDLIMIGLKAYQNTTSIFLKLRYAYQIVRLAHYSGLYEDCIKYYEQLVKPLFAFESIMKYWALEHKGGALRKLERNAEANLCFAQVFDKCPSRRYTAYQGFMIENDTEWQKMLSICANNEEKAALYLLRAMAPNANVLEEMQNIYQIDPQSEKLEALLIREINKLEFDLLKADLDKNIFFIQKYKGVAPSEAINYLLDLQQFINVCLSQNKINQPELWQLALVYTKVLNGNSAKAYQDLQKLNQEIKNPSLQQNIKTMTLLLEISQLKAVNGEIEEKIFQKIQAFKNNFQPKNYYFKAQNDVYAQLLEYVQRVFQHLYSPQQEAKKILSNPYFSLEELKLKGSLSEIKLLISFIEKKKKNAYEIFLAEKIASEPIKQQSILYELEGTVYLFGNQYIEALAAFKKIPQSNTFLTAYKRNPFLKIHKRTYNNIDKNRANSFIINKLTITQEIISLNQKITQNAPNLAETYYKLGNLYFNLTTYGDFYDIFNPMVGQYLEEGNRHWVGYKYVSVRFFNDCSIALSYFEKGMKEAIQNGDLELAAKCCFGMAECQNHQFFNQKKWWEKVTEKEKTLKINYEKALAKTLNEYNMAFEDLYFYFNQTKYYQEILKECSYFNEFVNSR